jgi:Protein of unknown function (DUF2510)
LDSLLASTRFSSPAQAVVRPGGLRAQGVQKQQSDYHPPVPEQLPPQGWYLDPWGMGWRWWNGVQWTEYLEADPRATKSPPSASPRSASSSRDWLGPALVGVLVLIGVALIVVAALKFA